MSFYCRRDRGLGRFASNVSTCESELVALRTGDCPLVLDGLLGHDAGCGGCLCAAAQAGGCGRLRGEAVAGACRQLGLLRQQRRCLWPLIWITFNLLSELDEFLFLAEVWQSSSLALRWFDFRHTRLDAATLLAVHAFSC